MVNLCVTRPMLDAINYCKANAVTGWAVQAVEGEPSLDSVQMDDPISHDQLIKLAKMLKDHYKQNPSYSPNGPSEKLLDMLRGSQVYLEPPNPKAEPTYEYKALMAKLKKDEESRMYERMTNPPPMSLRELRNQPLGSNDVGQEDELTYADVNRQVAAIFNVLISIVACSVAIWMAARHWSTPSRLGLSMGGGGLVGVAEIAIYIGYLRRVLEAKQREKKKPEIKTITDTWSTKERPQKPQVIAASESQVTSDPEGLRSRGRKAIDIKAG